MLFPSTTKCRVTTDLLNNSVSPLFFGFTCDKISPKLPIEQQLFRINLYSRLYPRIAESLFYLMNPLNIIAIEIYIMRTYYSMFVIYIFTHIFYPF